MDRAKELNITFIAKYREWYYEIIHLLDENQKRNYKKTRLSDIALSLSRRLSEMNVLAGNVALEMAEIRKKLNFHQNQVEECIKKGKSFPFIEEYHTYRILAYMECYIALLKSAVDFIYSYMAILLKNVLKQKRLRLNELMKEAGIDMQWKTELDAIRNDFLHQYSGWPSFIKKDGTYDIILRLPSCKVINEESKKYKEEKLTTQKINIMSESFGKFYDEARIIIKKEIKRLNNRVKSNLVGY